MKTSRLLMAAAFGSVAVLACSSDPEPQPNPATVNTVTSTATVAGPVTNSVTNGTSVTNAAVNSVSVTNAVTATATAGSTTGGGTTTGAAVTTTGAGGATSTAATSATATTGGPECQVTTPATAAVPITPADGWVQCNDIGIQGAFYTYGDEMGSTIMPGDFTDAGDMICVSGEVAATATGIWGAGVGFNLNQDNGSDVTNPWSATAAGISGISFTLDVLPPGGLMRLIFASGGTDYCVEVTAAGAQTISFADTTEDCWEAGGDAPDVTTLEAVKWQVAAVTDAYPFEFCLSAIQAVP